MLGSDIFNDVPRGSYFDSAVGELYGMGVIKGLDSDHFGPNDYVTRGQVAVMLQRFKNDLEGNGSNDDDDDNDSSSSRSSRSNVSTSSHSSSSFAATSNNPKGSIRFTTSNFSSGENVSKANITVVRTGGNQGTVSVNYAVTAGSATDGSDFSIASGTLTFENNQTSKTFQVDIKNDTSSEGNETVNLSISSPTNGASLGNPSSATLTILDDESGGGNSSGNSSSSAQSSTSSNPHGLLNFSALSYAVPEDKGSITVTISRDGGSNGAVNVNYTTANGTGKSGTDYTATNGTLNFSSGETSKTLAIAISDDSSVDGSKTFTIALSGQTGGAGLGSQSTTTVTMLDDETDDFSTATGSLKFSKATYDVTEGSGKADIIVQRITGNKGTVSVNYSTVSGTGFSGVDFTSTSGTLTFQPGETSKIISIPVLKDSSSESGDNFYVELASPTANASLASPYSTTVNIYD